MKLNTLTIVIFGAGIILLYAGIKDKNPKDVIMFSLRGDSPANAPGGASANVAPSVALNPNVPKGPNHSGTVNV